MPLPWVLGFKCLSQVLLLAEFNVQVHQPPCLPLGGKDLKMEEDQNSRAAASAKGRFRIIHEGPPAAPRQLRKAIRQWERLFHAESSHGWSQHPGLRNIHALCHCNKSEMQQDTYAPHPTPTPYPMSLVCLLSVEKLSQKIREVRKCRNKGKQSKETK